MAALLEFVSGLLDGLGLLALALSVGGIVYALAVLRAMTTLSEAGHVAFKVCLNVVVLSASLFAVFRAVQLLLKPWALADVTGEWAIAAFMQTEVFRSGVVGIVLMMCLAGAVLWVSRDVTKTSRWGAVILPLILLMVNEARLSHAASRLEGGGPLMAVTAVHMSGAVLWAGGVGHLLLSWSLRRRHPEVSLLWPDLLARFSPLGVTCAVLLIGPGAYLAWQYVGDWRGLIGTGYGSMLAVKVGFLVFVLTLAARNFSAARVWERTRDRFRADHRAPPYIEVEVILASALLFTAAALTSFPPAVDVREDAATAGEIWTMFSPKLPHLQGPEVVMIEAPELTDLRTGEIGYKKDVRWDRFNHNVSGVILLAIVLLAFLDQTRRIAWARHWPLMFVAFSVVLVLFANPDEWPLGPLGLVESAQNTEVVQHWLAAVVVFGLGVFEWRARSEVVANSNLPFVFPVLCIVGGIVLLTHSHQISELKREFLIQSTHVSMGFLGVIVGCSRWLELRLPPPHDRTAGYIALSGILLVGLILLFYLTPE